MNKKGLVLIIVGNIFLLISVLMVIYNNCESKNAGIKSKNVYEMIQKSLQDEKNIAINNEMKEVNIEGNNYIATINIPALNLNLPVQSVWDYDKMKTTPCRYYGSIFTNDLVICAHSYDTLFGEIKNLKVGDKLILTDMSNNKYIYEMKVIEILSSYDVKEMIESDFDLTLYTCTTDNLNRVTVRLNRV